MKQILSHLFEYKSFDESQAYDILSRMTAGEFNSAQIAAFLTTYSMRSIRVEELRGFQQAMYDRCLPVSFDDYELIDLCGTGGDGKNTFNISTLASFVVAGAGYSVAKHGNYGVSSGCGSSNVMEHLGYRFTNDQETLKKQLDQANICFLHAPLFHPAMKYVAPIRKELGIKTFFNMLGPLTNPAAPTYQAVGVFSLELARLYHYLLQGSTKQYTIVYALDGYDEISLTGDFKTLDQQGEHYHALYQMNLKPLDAQTIKGGDTIDQAAKIFVDVLHGRGTDEQNLVVLTNAAFAIRTIKPALSHEQSVEEAQASLFGKKALNAFHVLINNT